jgi:ribosomal protein S27AE
MSSNNADCPRCGSSDTRRLQIIHEEGLQDSRSRSTGIGVGDAPGIGLGGGIGFATTRGVQQSRLSLRTAPPKKREAGLAAVALVFVTIVALVGETPIWWGLAVLLGTICIGDLIMTRQFNKNRWPEIYARWLDTYMCRRCGDTFTFAARTPVAIAKWDGPQIGSQG